MYKLRVYTKVSYIFVFREKIAVPLTHSFWFFAVYFFVHSLTPFGDLRYIFLQIVYFFAHRFLTKNTFFNYHFDVLLRKQRQRNDIVINNDEAVCCIYITK